MRGTRARGGLRLGHQVQRGAAVWYQAHRGLRLGHQAHRGLLCGTRPRGGCCVAPGPQGWLGSQASGGQEGRGGGYGAGGQSGKGRTRGEGKHRSEGRLRGAGSRGSDVTAPPAPTPSPSQPLTGGSMSLRRADTAPSAGASGAVGGAAGGAASHWLRRSGLGRAMAPPRGRGRNRCGTSGRVSERDPRPPPAHEGTRRRRRVVYIKSFYFVPTEIPGWGRLLYGVTTQRGTGGGGLLRVSRSTADTHTVTMVRGRSAGIALTTVNSSWGAARPRVQPRPGTYLQRGGRRGRARQRGGAGSPARKPGARIAVGTAMNRWRRERERRKRKKEKKRRKEKESRQRTASTETR